MICPLCKKKGYISCGNQYQKYSKSIRCCTNCYNNIKQNKMAQIKAEQRRILREEGESINRLLRKILPKTRLVLGRSGIVKIWRKDEKDKVSKQ
jgi:hypothetical protein